MTHTQSQKESFEITLTVEGKLSTIIIPEEIIIQKPQQFCSILFRKIKKEDISTTNTKHPEKLQIERTRIVFSFFNEIYMPLFYGCGSTDSRHWRHYKEASYFQPSNPQDFLVLTFSILEG